MSQSLICIWRHMFKGKKKTEVCKKRKATVNVFTLSSRFIFFFYIYCILTLMTPGKSTNTILCKPGPFTLKEMVCEVKLKLKVHTLTSFVCNYLYKYIKLSVHLYTYALNQQYPPILNRKSNFICTELWYKIDFNSPNTLCIVQNIMYTQTGFTSVLLEEYLKKMHMYRYSPLNIRKSYLSANSASFLHAVSHSDFYFISQSCKLF